MNEDNEPNEWARQLADMVQAWERQPNHIVERYLNQKENNQ